MVSLYKFHLHFVHSDEFRLELALTRNTEKCIVCIINRAVLVFKVGDQLFLVRKTTVKSKLQYGN